MLDRLENGQLRAAQEHLALKRGAIERPEAEHGTRGAFACHPTRSTINPGMSRPPSPSG
jgi:hypothetical protein